MSSLITPLIIKRTNKELEYFIKKEYLNDNISERLKQIYSELTFTPYIQNSYNNNNTYHIKIMRNIAKNENLAKNGNSEENEVVLDLLIPNNYPFIPAKVHDFDLSQNYMNYSRFLVNVVMNKMERFTENKEIMSFYYSVLFEKNALLVNSSCFCCSSYGCANNWNPGLRINNFVQEYYEAKFILENSSIKNYILNKHCYDKIVKEYLKDNYDILNHIIGFIIT